MPEKAHVAAQGLAVVDSPPATTRARWPPRPCSPHDGRLLRRTERPGSPLSQVSRLRCCLDLRQEPATGRYADGEPNLVTG
jgi:hypothetical protein